MNGFLKEALDPELSGAIVGAAAGYAAMSGGSPLARVLGAATGAGLFSEVGAGLRGASEAPDYAGLTDGELAVAAEEARALASARNRRRAAAAAIAVGSSIMSRSPWPVAIGLPAMTVLPYAGETERLRRLADDFRKARR